MKGEIAVRYTIRHFDLPLLTFEANMDSADTDLHIINVYEENRSFLPLNLTVSEDGVERWLRHRTIPKNRAYVDALLSKVGLSLNRPLGIIAANKGLSLNDCFWVDAEGSGDTFEKVNLYDNRFSQVLAAIAFTGYGSSIRTSLASCPEFSTNGMLPKCWRRQNRKIYLYKGGTSGFSNLGFEPYSELYDYQVAQAMGVNAIRYTLTKDLKKTLCSKCELFTSKEYSYIPIGQLVSKGGMKAIFEYYQTLGQNFVDALEDMLVFDAIICNTDRHYGNFGVLVDNKTNTIAAPAPLFDHGNSLFSLGGTDLWDNQKAFDESIVLCGREVRFPSLSHPARNPGPARTSAPSHSGRLSGRPSSLPSSLQTSVTAEPVSLNVMHSISPPTNFCMASRVLSSSISFGSSIGRSARTLIFSSFIVCLQIKTGQSTRTVLQK